jgi:hypothetical protein
VLLEGADEVAAIRELPVRGELGDAQPSGGRGQGEPASTIVDLIDVKVYADRTEFNGVILTDGHERQSALRRRRPPPAQRAGV